MESPERASKIADVAPRILAHLASGAYLEVACRAVGIHPDTLDNWRKWGKEGREPYATFLDEFEKARAQAEVALLVKVSEGDERWQGPAWVLERTRHGRYRQHQTTEHTGDAEQPLWMRIVEAQEQPDASS